MAISRKRAQKNKGNRSAGTVRNRINPPILKVGFDDLKIDWDKLNARRGETLQTDVLKILPPRAKLDPIAISALKILRDNFKSNAVSPENLERNVRATITSKGIASKVKKVTDRLNRRRMTDGRRWVLATTYMHLLSELFRSEPDNEALSRVMNDDLGVAERLMLDLEAPKGPFEAFAAQIVDLVMKKNRVAHSEVILEIVSQQVRAAI